MEREITKVEHGRFVLLPITAETRGHATHSLPAVWGKYLAELLSGIAPSAIDGYAVDESDETAILGYYTVTTTHIEAGALPSRTLRKLKLPKHELPAALVARLAVSERRQKHGIGSLLLIEVLARCARAADEIGGVAIAVDAVNESVVAWYELLGSMRFEPGSLNLDLRLSESRGDHASAATMAPAMTGRQR